MPGPLKTLRRCITCGKEYRPNGWKQRYCPVCGRIHELERVREYERAYREAHEEKTRADAKRRYAERKAGRPLKMPGHRRGVPIIQKICLRCGVDFIPANGNQKFCEPCRPFAFRELRRADRLHWTEETRERNRETKRIYYQRNKEIIAPKARLRRTEYADRIRRRVLGHYSSIGTPACVCCGESEIDFLTLDHVNNDGAQMRRRLFKKPNQGGVRFYRWVMKNGYPENLQTLCYNCNCSKGKHGECVHKLPVHVTGVRATILDQWVAKDPQYVDRTTTGTSTQGTLSEVPHSAEVTAYRENHSDTLGAR